MSVFGDHGHTKKTTIEVVESVVIEEDGSLARLIMIANHGKIPQYCVLHIQGDEKLRGQLIAPNSYSIAKIDDPNTAYMFKCNNAKSL